MLSKIEQVALMARCAAFDDRAAFARLVEEYEVPLRRFLMGMGVDYETSRDIVQETFLKMWINARSFKGLSSPRTWVYRIATNLVHDHFKDRGTEDTDLAQVTNLVSIDESHATESAIDARHALSLVDEYDRRLLVLFHINEMSIKDIAKITEMQQGTVKSRLSRARSLIRQKLES